MRSPGTQSWYFMTASIPSSLFLACTQQFGATRMREKYKTMAADSEERQLQPRKLWGFCAGYDKGLRGPGSDSTHLSGTRPEQDTPCTARSPAGLARGSSSGCSPPGAGGWLAAPGSPTERGVRAEASELRPFLSSPLPPRSPAWSRHLLRVHGSSSDSEERRRGQTPRQPEHHPAAASQGLTLSLFLPQRGPAPPPPPLGGRSSVSAQAQPGPPPGGAELNNRAFSPAPREDMVTSAA